MSPDFWFLISGHLQGACDPFAAPSPLPLPAHPPNHPPPILPHLHGPLAAQVSVGHGVDAAGAPPGPLVGRRLVAEAVAFVDHLPERAGPRLPRQAQGVAQTAGKYAAPAPPQIELVDGRPALLDRHAA